MPRLSAIIMTKNEEEVIARCIDSVNWVDEIVVIDSGSTDGTKAIAEAKGAYVFEQEWLGFSAQRNRGAELARHDWVLAVDADEVVSKELAASIREVMKGEPDPQDGYALDRRGDFLGSMLPNQTRPSKRRNFVRLYNRKFGKYDESMSVHEEVRFPGKAIPLEGVLIHWNGFTMDEFTPLFNRYATVEARELHEKGKRATWLDIFFRPIMRFGWLYFVKGGWRLGMRGLMHALLKGNSEFIRYAKLWEMQNAGAPYEPPPEIYDQTPKSDKDQQAPK